MLNFEERYDDPVSESTILYFTAPKELLHKEYPDAVAAEISIEIPFAFPEPEYWKVAISPTKEENGTLIDYDWTDAEVTPEEIEILLLFTGVTL